MEERGLSSVVAILLILGVVVVAGALVSTVVFDASPGENTGEPSVRVSDTSSGRTVTLIRGGEVGKVVVESGNDTYNLTEVGSSVTISRRNGTLIYAEREGDRELIRQVEPNPITTLNVDTDNFTVTNGSLLVSFEASKKVNNIEVGIGGNMSGALTEDDFSLVKEFNKSNETWYRYQAKTELRAYYVIGKLQTAATRGVDGARGQEAVLDLPRPGWLCDRGNLTTTCYVNSSKDLTGNYTRVIGNLTLEENADVTTGKGDGTTSKIKVGENTTLDCGDMRGNFNISTQNILVKSCSSIIADGYGYAAGNGPCPGTTGSYSNGGGAGHGGRGGTGDGNEGGCTYGSLTEPITLGSGGVYRGSPGGGRVTLLVENKTEINGPIKVNGSDDSGGDSAGAGGSIYIETDVFKGLGSLYANGGDTSGSGGGGGGGRISVKYSEQNWSGSAEVLGGVSGSPSGEYGSLIFTDRDSGETIRSDACNLDGLYECTVLRGAAIDNNTFVRTSSTFQNHTISIEGDVVMSPYTSGINLEGETVNINSTISGSIQSDVNIRSYGNSIHVNSNLVAGDISLISDGNITVSKGSTVSAVGRGYPAGNGPCPGTTGTYSNGGGAGHGGRGGTGDGNEGGCTYGSLTEPTTFGSGGVYRGSSGGGRVKIETQESAIVDGKVTVNGSNDDGESAGAGGSIYINAKKFSGSGRLYANGGDSSGSGGAGGGGRISVKYDRFSWSGTTEALGGTAGGRAGEYGTLLYTNKTSGDTIRSDGCSLTGRLNCEILTAAVIENKTMAKTTLSDGHEVELTGNVDLYKYTSDATVDADNVTISGKVDGQIQSTLEIRSESSVTVNGTVEAGTVNVTSKGSTEVTSSSLISAVGRGYAAGNGPCPGTTGTYSNGGGAGHGGRGGTGDGNEGGCTYGSLTEPTTFGSGGVYRGSSGGGRVKIKTQESAIVDGKVTVNGSNDDGESAGAGGSIYIDAKKFSGSGRLYANGGDSSGSGGAGGGGRISVKYDRFSWSGTTEVLGGTTGGRAGEYGTLLYTNKTSGNIVRSDGCSLTGRLDCEVLTAAVIENKTIAKTTLSDGHEVELTGNVDLYKYTSDATVDADNVTISGKVDGQIQSTLEIRSESSVTVNGTVEAGTINVTSKGDTKIETSSLVSAVGRGYAAGNGPCPGTTGTYSNGGGAGHGGRGGTGDGNEGGCTYGSLTEPTTFGSGGVYRGSSGGGRVKIKTQESAIVDGKVTVNGSNDDGESAGAGGSIYIDAEKFSGSGRLYANGGDSSGSGGAGGGGRISVEYDRFSWSGTTEALGGESSLYGEFGSVHFENTSNSSVIRSDACRLQGAYDCTIPSGAYIGNDSLIQSSAKGHRVVVSGDVELYSQTGAMNVEATSFDVKDSSSISGGHFTTVEINSDSAKVMGNVSVSTFNVSVSNFTQSGSSVIDASGLGYRSGGGPCPGSTGTYSVPGGAGHGGRGGNSSDGKSGGCTYGSKTTPTELGSGGIDDGGSGGGRVKIVATGGVDIKGTILADGVSGTSYSGGGAGGSIYIDGSSVSGSASLSATGGDGRDGGGGGGGGRISIIGGSFSGTVNVSGGSGAEDGESGTFYNP